MSRRISSQEYGSAINSAKLAGLKKYRNSIENPYRNPNVILMDETLSSVDEEVERRIMNEVLRKYVENFRKSQNIN